MKPKTLFVITMMGIAVLAGADRWQARLIAQERFSARLRTAAAKGDATTTAALLRQGADPDAASPSESLSFWQFCRARFHPKRSSIPPKSTPLLLCLAWRDAEDDCPPENVALVRTLLDAGADPNARDANGYTPLMLAVETGKTETARLLLQHRARVNIKAADGETALLLAQAWKNAPLVALLKQLGARP